MKTFIAQLDVVKAFDGHLGARSLAPNTRKMYVSDLKQFVSWMVDAEVCSAESKEPERFSVSSEAGVSPTFTGEITKAVVGASVEIMERFFKHDSGKALTSVHRSKCALAVFYGWIIALGLIAENPAKMAKCIRNRPANQGVRRISFARLKAIQELTWSSNDSIGDLRDGLMLKLVAEHALKISELSRLKGSDLLHGDGLQVSGSRWTPGIAATTTRTIQLSSDVYDGLKTLLRRRPSGFDEEKPIFLSQREQGLTQRNIRRRLDVYQKKFLRGGTCNSSDEIRNACIVSWFACGVTRAEIRMRTGMGPNKSLSGYERQIPAWEREIAACRASASTEATMVAITPVRMPPPTAANPVSQSVALTNPLKRRATPLL